MDFYFSNYLSLKKLNETNEPVKVLTDFKADFVF